MKYTMTVLNSLKQVADEARHAKGCDNPVCQNYSPEGVRAAVKGVDVTFVCLGTGTSIEDEGQDRVDMNLPGYQLQLLQDVVAWGRLKLLFLNMYVQLYTGSSTVISPTVKGLFRIASL
jgi:hypothetical protein